jgi:hypothetical protein
MVVCSSVRTIVDLPRAFAVCWRFTRIGRVVAPELRQFSPPFGTVNGVGASPFPDNPT